MSAALEALKLFAERWGPEAKITATKLGEFFQGLSKDPGYFATSKVIPQPGNDARIAQELAAKHGFNPREFSSADGELIHTPSGSYIQPSGYDPQKMARLADHLRQKAEMTTNPDDLRTIHSSLANLEEQLAWVRASRPSGPLSSLYSIDMMGAAPGQGTAKKLYPMFNDWVLAHPGSGDLTTSLTENNAAKKGIYTAGALEKYGDMFRNRTRMMPEQLDNDYGINDNVGQFQKMSTGAQIGALNARGADLSNEKLSALLTRGKQRFNSLSMDDDWFNLDNSGKDALAKLGDSFEKASKMGLSPSTVISTNHDLSGISDIIGGISEGIGRPRPLGMDSLRRTAITNDVLADPRLAPEDLYGSGIIKALARAKGGPVSAPHKPAGPLSQCSCGAK